MQLQISSRGEMWDRDIVNYLMKHVNAMARQSGRKVERIDLRLMEEPDTRVPEQFCVRLGVQLRGGHVRVHAVADTAWRASALTVTKMQHQFEHSQARRRWRRKPRQALV